MKPIFPTLLKLIKSNPLLFFLSLGFPITFILFFKSTTKPQTSTATSFFKSTPLGLFELEKQTQLYSSKIKAYKQAKEKKDKQLHTPEPYYVDFPSSLKEQPNNLIQNTSPEPLSLLKPVSISLQKETSKKKMLPTKNKSKEPLTKKEAYKKEKQKKRKELEAFMRLSLDKPTSKDILVAEINHNQIISNGKEIRFHLLEDLLLEGITIAAYTPFYGKASFNTHRIEVSFSSIIYQNNLLPFNYVLYDFDGFKGIAIDSKEELLDKEQRIKKEALDLEENLDSLQAGKYIAKGVHSLKRVFGKKVKKPTVHLISGHRILLKKLKTT
jgi:hypothetical protein